MIKTTNAILDSVYTAIANDCKYVDVIVDDLLACICDTDDDSLEALADYIDNLLESGKAPRVTPYNTEATDGNDDRHFVVKLDTVIDRHVVCLCNSTDENNAETEFATAAEADAFIAENGYTVLNYDTVIGDNHENIYLIYVIKPADDTVLN